MNQYVTGSTIKELREKKKMTQAELADILAVSDKSVSKWETGNGYPDITLLEPLAKALGVSVSELISGETINNTNISANMLKSKFYVCPVCGNVITSVGEVNINCHGINLKPCDTELTNEEHKVFIEKVEDEYYVSFEHEMSKKHYLSFVCAISPDRIQMVKLYPESFPEARFQIRGVKKIYYYCNRDGLFYIDVVKGIDDKQKSYDDTKERQELEEAARKLFG